MEDLMFEFWLARGHQGVRVIEKLIIHCRPNAPSHENNYFHKEGNTKESSHSSVNLDVRPSWWVWKPNGSPARLCKIAFQQKMLWSFWSLQDAHLTDIGVQDHSSSPKQISCVDSVPQYQPEKNLMLHLAVWKPKPRVDWIYLLMSYAICERNRVLIA